MMECFDLVSGAKEFEGSMENPRHLALGEAGEKMAARYLEKKGYSIVGRRVRCGGGEIDIIARLGKEWVFVEVKTRSSDRMGTAAEALTRGKATRLARAVVAYMTQHELHDSPVRCDLLAIDFDGDVPRIEHFPAAMDLE